MKISKQTIPHIERAIGFKLYDHQIKYLLNEEDNIIRKGRASGKTIAYCIKLALTDGKPLDMNKPYEFSDYGDGSRRYTYIFFRSEFMKYWHMLKNYGFPVRRVVF